MHETRRIGRSALRHKDGLTNLTGNGMRRVRLAHCVVAGIFSVIPFETPRSSSRPRLLSNFGLTRNGSVVPVMPFGNTGANVTPVTDVASVEPMKAIGSTGGLTETAGGFSDECDGNRMIDHLWPLVRNSPGKAPWPCGRRPVNRNSIHAIPVTAKWDQKSLSFSAEARPLPLSPIHESDKSDAGRG